MAESINPEMCVKENSLNFFGKMIGMNNSKKSSSVSYQDGRIDPGVDCSREGWLGSYIRSKKKSVGVRNEDYKKSSMRGRC